MSTKITGPVSFYVYKCRNISYYLIGDMHFSFSGACGSSCKANCITITDLLNQWLSHNDQHKLSTSLWIEAPVSLSLVPMNSSPAKPENGWLDSIENIYSSCYDNSGNCPYNPSSIHVRTIDIRKNKQPDGEVYQMSLLTISEIVNMLINPQRDINMIDEIKNAVYVVRIMLVYAYQILDMYLIPNQRETLFMFGNKMGVISGSLVYDIVMDHIAFVNISMDKEGTSYISSAINDSNQNDVIRIFIKSEFSKALRRINKKILLILEDVEDYLAELAETDNDKEKKEVMEDIMICLEYIDSECLVELSSLVVDAYVLARLLGSQDRQQIVYAGYSHIQTIARFFSDELDVEPLLATDNMLNRKKSKKRCVTIKDLDSLIF